VAKRILAKFKIISAMFSSFYKVLNFCKFDLFLITSKRLQTALWWAFFKIAILCALVLIKNSAKFELIKTKF